MTRRVDGDAELVADLVVALVNGVLETIDDADRWREAITLTLDRLTEGRLRPR